MAPGRPVAANLVVPFSGRPTSGLGAPDRPVAVPAADAVQELAS